MTVRVSLVILQLIPSFFLSHHLLPDLIQSPLWFIALLTWFSSFSIHFPDSLWILQLTFTILLLSIYPPELGLTIIFLSIDLLFSVTSWFPIDISPTFYILLTSLCWSCTILTLDRHPVRMWSSVLLCYENMRCRLWWTAWWPMSASYCRCNHHDIYNISKMHLADRSNIYYSEQKVHAFIHKKASASGGGTLSPRPPTWDLPLDPTVGLPPPRFLTSCPLTWNPEFASV